MKMDNAPAATVIATGKGLPSPPRVPAGVSIGSHDVKQPDALRVRSIQVESIRLFEIFLGA
jgi:hypothetical protein